MLLFSLACILLPLIRLSEARPAEVVQGISLEGTRAGPTGFYMTQEEREEYRERVLTDPQEKERFKKVLRNADGFVEGRDDKSLDCAKAYVVTRDKKYLNALESHLVYCANWWLDIFGTNPGRRYRVGAGWICGPRRGYVVDLNAPEVYDLVAEDLDPEAEKLVRAYMKSAIDGMREWAEDDKTLINKKTCPTWSQGQTTNMAARTYGYWSKFAFAIGYDEMIEWVLDHKREPGAFRDKGGLVQWITGKLYDHAIWQESPVYHWAIGSSIACVAEWAAHYDGRNVWAMTAPDGTVARDVMDGRIALAYPREENGIGKGAFRIATYGEGLLGFDYGAQYLVNGTLGSLSRWEAMLRSIYRATGESKYGWFLTFMEDPPLGLVEGLSPPPAPSNVFPNAGVCMLRGDETPGYWMGQGLAMMVRGGEMGRTAPGDRYSIRLHGAGRLLYPDWETSHSYERYRVVGWKRATPRRNTALIDGKEGWCHRTIYRCVFHPEVKYLSLRGSAYGHDRMERAFMMTKDYLLDVYDLSVQPETVPEMDFMGVPSGNQYVGWTGASLLGPEGKMPESHTFDWIVHGIGRQFPRNWELYEPDEELMKENWPNRWLENVQRRDIGEDQLVVDWIQTSGGLRPEPEVKDCGPVVRWKNPWRQFGQQWWDGRAGVRLRMLGEAGTVAYTAEAPWRPGVVDRDKYPEETIKTVWVRRRGKAAIFTALHEAYKDEPRIRDFAYLHRLSRGEEPNVVAAKVVGPDYVDRLYMTLGLRGHKGTERVGASALKKQKEEVRNLTLDWLFKTDPRRAGEEERWFSSGHDRSDWRKVDAGVNWQEFQKGYYGTAWYAKRVEPVELPPKEKVYLLFEGVDEDCWVYVDGKRVKERVAEFMGQLWNKSFLVDVTDLWSSGEPHLLVAKVRKKAYQTGIYRPVRLMVETSSEPERSSGEPLVTVTSDDDPNEQVAFRGQAYLRATGKQLIARGELASLCVFAPKASELILNGNETPCRTERGYVIWGGAKAPAGGTRQGKPFPSLPESAPIEVSFPQVYPNIDAQEGGMLIVRISNRTFDKTLSGELEVKPGKGLKVEPTKKTFASLGPDSRSEFAFEVAVDGAERGRIVPVEVLAHINSPTGMALAHRRTAQVAVGVVVSGSEETYVIPEYDCTDGMPGKLKPQDAERPYGYPKSYDFSYIQVRAPGYTLRVDKPSGTVKYLMDPSGKLRSNQAGHLYSKIRIRKYGGSYHQVTVPEDPTRAVLGPEGFAWKDEAQFLGIESDQQGMPVARFRSGDGKTVGEYHFGARSFSVTPKMFFRGFDLPGPYEPQIKGNEVAFVAPAELELNDNEPILSRYEAYQPPAPPSAGPNLLAGNQMRVEEAEGVTVGAGLGHEGGAAIEVDLAKRDEPILVEFPVSIQKGKHVFSVWMRHEGVENVHPPTHSGDRPFRIAVLRAGSPDYWHSARDQTFTIPRTNPSYRPGGTRDWYVVQWEVDVDIPTGVTFQLSVHPDATGKVWYSDFDAAKLE